MVISTNRKRLDGHSSILYKVSRFHAFHQQNSDSEVWKISPNFSFKDETKYFFYKMENSGKIALSLWKMSTIRLILLCVFFDQVCFSISHPIAESSQLRPGQNSLEAPASDAEVPAAVSLQHPSRARRDPHCCNEFKLLNTKFTKVLSINLREVRGVTPYSGK